MSKMSEMAKRAAELLKPRMVMFTEQELRKLHQCVNGMYKLGVQVGREDLELQDLEARLATVIELPVDEKEVLLQMVPEHLRDAVKRLLWSGDEHVALAVWCEADVIGKAQERGMEITREQAQEILEKMDRQQDSELGITWTTIDVLLDELEDLTHAA